MRETKKASMQRKDTLRATLRQYDTYESKAAYCSGIISMIAKRYDLTPTQALGMIREVVEVLEGEEI